MRIIKDFFINIKNRYGGLYLSIVSIFVLLDLIASIYISSFYICFIRFNCFYIYKQFRIRA